MKWLTNRYAYPLVILVIIVSVLLQFAWLSQLFRAQKEQAKTELEQLVANSAELSTYYSLTHDHEMGANFRNFFLSSGWLQFKQGYNEMMFNHISTRFKSDIKGDSTFVDVSLRIFNGRPPYEHRGHVMRYDGKSLTLTKDSDLADLNRMNKIVNKQISELGCTLKNNYVIYPYDDVNIPHGLSPGMIKDADFTSKKYSYDLRFIGLYQLVIPSVNRLVIFRMRYYLLSSFLMLLLTVSVFFFILRLMKNQRLYAQARLSFTSNMTHELKTPVATIAIALESIVDSNIANDPETLKSYLEISRGELKRLNLMIDKVLNLEQLSNESERLRMELFDVQDGLSQVISSMKLQIGNSGAVINYRPLDIPCFVSGDPVHLNNVFYNLIENALKYGGEHVKIDINCEINTHEVKISFRDNGPGIAKIYHHRIFERFFRVPNSTSDIHNVKGTGLGLNYVRHVIEMHKGHVKIESEPGAGSTFILFLPAVT